MEALTRCIRKNGNFLLLNSFIIALLFVAGVGVCEIPEPPELAPWYIKAVMYILMQFPDVNGWFAASMFFIMTLLRGLSEAFLFIAKKTETKKDDIIAKELVKLMRWASTIIGWFGLGTPKK